MTSLLALPRLSFFLLLCNHIEDIKQFTLNKFMGVSFQLGLSIWLSLCSCLIASSLFQTWQFGLNLSFPRVKWDRSALHHLVVHIHWTCCSLLWDYGKLPKFYSDCCCTDAGRVANVSSLGRRCILKESKHCKQMLFIVQNWLSAGSSWSTQPKLPLCLRWSLILPPFLPVLLHLGLLPKCLTAARSWASQKLCNVLFFPSGTHRGPETQHPSGRQTPAGCTAG